MSSIGLNTNTFRITGKYLDLLNDFVVSVKVNQDVDEGQKEHLIDFLSQIRDENNTQPQFQLLSNMVERELRFASKNFDDYLKSLIEGVKANKTDEFLPKIEFLADILDTENSDALLKIVGE